MCFSFFFQNFILLRLFPFYPAILSASTEEIYPPDGFLSLHQFNFVHRSTSPTNIVCVTFSTYPFSYTHTPHVPRWAFSPGHAYERSHGSLVCAELWKNKTKEKNFQRQHVFASVSFSFFLSPVLLLCCQKQKIAICQTECGGKTLFTHFEFTHA